MPRRLLAEERGRGLTLAFTAASSYAFLPRLVTLLRERMPALRSCLA